MGANETRLVVLAALSILQPANGYQVRRELIAWGIDRWAHVQPGSIYSSLSTMAKHGVIEEVPAPAGSRGVTAYQVTEAGQGEMLRLFEHALVTVEPSRPLGFFTAVNVAVMFPREVYLKHLRRRLAVHEAWQVEIKERRSDELPDYVKRSLVYWDGSILNEMEWLRGTIELVESGGLTFPGEEGHYGPRPPGGSIDEAANPDDYRRMLGLSPELMG